MLSLSTSPLIALHRASLWSLTPPCKNTTNTHKIHTHTNMHRVRPWRTHTLCQTRDFTHTHWDSFHFSCTYRGECKEVLAIVMSHMLRLSPSFLFLPQIPARGPQRSLKQQLQADAGPDYNRTRRLLFITTSSTELRHFNCRRRSLTTQSRDKATTKKGKRRNIPVYLITYKSREDRMEIQRVAEESLHWKVLHL